MYSEYGMVFAYSKCMVLITVIVGLCENDNLHSYIRYTVIHTHH